MRHSSHLATRKDAHTPPKPRKRLPLRKILVALAAAFLYTAVMGSGENMESFPLTTETMAFFATSGYPLRTYILHGKTTIDKDQWGDTTIHLNKYTVETVPDEIVQGIKFRHLNIRHPSEFRPWLHQPVRRVLEKLLRVLGSVQIDSLAVIGLDMSLSEPTQTSPTQDTNSLANAPKPTSSPTNPKTQDTANKPPRLLKLYSNHIYLKEMNGSSIQWLLARIDASECVLSLTIDRAYKIRNLLFLDVFNPKTLLKLCIWGTANLVSIDCALLKEQKVVDVLGLRGLKKRLYASPETLQAISSKHWAWIHVSPDLWRDIIAERRSQSFDVDYLTIPIDHGYSLDVIYEVGHQMKVSVKKLELRLGPKYYNTRTARSIKGLLLWAGVCFADTEEVEISGLWFLAMPTSTKHQYVYVEPWLPKLKRLHCSPTNGLYLYLYSGKSTLWIVPEAYQEWAWGNLNNQMVRASQEFICPILESTHPGLFLASPNTSPNPTCLVCGQSVNDFNEMGPQTRPKYLGIVCKAGHMACHPCLNKLSLEKHSAKELLHCPECNDEIVDTGINGVIRMSLAGPPIYQLFRLDNEFLTYHEPPINMGHVNVHRNNQPK
ncbi:hypothetical protein NEDG_00193 [Nematocida displodere]|uniref:RING-type domain-containing protein n=1 Tax=Nematocida displodere TaxID=1805483 RepID=A0A177EIK9_9MICR|nr:hypothetical protein NEDG_00193 [Nematocida displodere]